MLKYRLPSAVVLAGAIVLILADKGGWGRLAFLLLGMAVSALAMAEAMELICPGRPRSWRIIGATLALMGFALPLVIGPLLDRFFPHWHPAANIRTWVVLIGAWLLAGLGIAWGGIMVAADRREAARSAMAMAAAFVLVFLPLHCLTFVYLHMGYGPAALLFLLAATKAGDIGGYVAGMLTARLLPGGNHKMTPRLSPKKSWEGFAGGLALSILTAWLLRGLLPGNLAAIPALAAVLGALFYLGGLLGDLSVSALKRAAEVKDSGNLVPGMGGVLDVVDSLLLNAPLGLLLLLLNGLY